MAPGSGTALAPRRCEVRRSDNWWATLRRCKEVYDHISRVAPTSATVLIVGESGTGKELVAQALHEFSGRRQGPYVALNCSAMSPMLIESELFGHERGSFTGADRQHHGVFERAKRGTLFLDEVTEMPMELQVKLLRVLETGTFTRTGGEVQLSVNVRFLAATNRRPEEAIKQGKLREDLYYRLKVFQLSLRGLRDRIEDVPMLAEHFLTQTAALEGRPKRFTSEALAVLTAYSWPGNVRELKNAVYSAYILAGSEITVDCLPSEIVRPAPTPMPDNNVPVSIGMTAAEVERRLIIATLAHFDGSKTKAAETLGTQSQDAVQPTSGVPQTRLLKLSLTRKTPQDRSTRRLRSAAAQEFAQRCRLRARLP